MHSSHAFSDSLAEMSKVGTLDTLGRSVFERADGTFFYNDDGRVDVHGNQKWTAMNGHAMKGQHRDTGNTAAKTTAPAAKMTAPAAKAPNKGAMGGVFKMPDMAVEFAPFGAPKPKLETGSIKAWLDERGFGFIR